MAISREARDLTVEVRDLLAGRGIALDTYVVIEVADLIGKRFHDFATGRAQIRTPDPWSVPEDRDEPPF